MPLPTIVVSESVYKKARNVFESATRFRCVMAPDDEAGLVRAIEESGAAHAILGHRSTRMRCIGRSRAGGCSPGSASGTTGWTK